MRRLILLERRAPRTLNKINDGSKVLSFILPSTQSGQLDSNLSKRTRGNQGQIAEKGLSINARLIEAKQAHCQKHPISSVGKAVERCLAGRVEIDRKVP